MLYTTSNPQNGTFRFEGVHQGNVFLMERKRVGTSDGGTSVSKQTPKKGEDYDLPVSSVALPARRIAGNNSRLRPGAFGNLEEGEGIRDHRDGDPGILVPAVLPRRQAAADRLPHRNLQQDRGGGEEGTRGEPQDTAPPGALPEPDPPGHQRHGGHRVRVDHEQRGAPEAGGLRGDHVRA